MDDFSKKALQCHNECRHLHQVPPLKWAADLASEAQEWANKIARANNLQHASKSERKNSGENIAMFSGRFDTAAEQATGMWYSEVENYKFEKPSFQPGTGHFTQVVWKDSKEIGMARAKTPDGKSTYVVSRYRPAGNMLGSFEENVMKSKSKDSPSFIKTTDQSGREQESRVVERSWGSPGQNQTRVMVKETRTQTPQGVKTVKSTTTWTTSSNVNMTPTGKQENMEDPSTEFKSLHISDKEKPATKQQQPSQTKPKVSSQDAKPSGSFQEIALKMHNNYRRLHQVPDLRWSNDLARDAQAWAEQIARQNTLSHATSKERNGNGENLAYFGGKFDDVAKDSVNMWYSEEKKYQYKNSGFKSGTGHFTQMVWKESKELGMGWAKSPDGRSAYIVARYRPAGNMMGSFQQNVFPPKK